MGTLKIPFFVACFTALCHLTYTLAVSFKPKKDDAEETPYSLARANGGSTRLAFRVGRVIGIIVLLICSIVSLHKHDSFAFTDPFRSPEAFITCTYLYTSLLSLAALISEYNTHRFIASKSVTLILLSTWGVYAYRDLWPLATYTLHPKDSDQGQLLWFKISVLTILTIIMPLLIPRRYVPVDPKNPMSVPTSEQTASWLSLLTFTFMDPLIFLGSRVPHIPVDALPLLLDSDDAHYLTERGFRHLDRFRGAPDRHLFWGLLRNFIWLFVTMNIADVIVAFLALAVPIGLNRILHYLESPTPTPSTDPIRPWFWIACLCLGPLLRSVFEELYLYQSTQLRYRMKAVMTELVFEHGLRMRVAGGGGDGDGGDEKKDGQEGKGGGDEGNGGKDGDAGKKKGNLTGRINNAVTTDADNVLDGLHFASLVILTPVSIVVSIALLYQILGLSSTVALVLTILLGPLSGYIGTFMQSYERIKMQKTDTRVQKTSEVVSVLRMVKLFGWERKMIDLVNDTRKEELVVLRKLRILRHGNMLVGMFVPLLTQWATYAALTVFFDGDLVPSKIFSSVVLFSSLRYQIQSLSWGYNDAITAKVSLDRIDALLRDTELLDAFSGPADPSHLASQPRAEEEEDPRLGFGGCRFTWSARSSSSSSSTSTSSPSLTPSQTHTLTHESTPALTLTPPTPIPVFAALQAIAPGAANTSSGQTLSSASTLAAPTASTLNAPTPRSFTLKIPTDIVFKPGKLNVITGPTGCGKTAILMALLGEMHFVRESEVDLVRGSEVDLVRGSEVDFVRRSEVDLARGSEADSDSNYATGHTGTQEAGYAHGGNGKGWVNLPRSGGVAYAAQESWVLNATIKENVVFGNRFDEERYMKVMEQCALNRDLELFEAGDQTEVGERGLTLSGGQKARLTLARAVYSPAQVILLDDIFAALDVHTSASIAKECFGGDLMQGRTVVLITHNIALVLPMAEFLLTMSADGTIVTEDIDPASAPQDSIPSETEEKASSIDDTDPEKGTKKPDGAAGDGKLILAEEIAQGTVSWHSFKLFIYGLGGDRPIVFLVVFGLLMFIYEMLTLSQMWFLGYWGSKYENPGHEPVSAWYYLNIYAAIIVVSLFFAGFHRYYFMLATMRASESIHAKLVQSVLTSTLRWLDETPTGRILARFTQDIRNIDGNLTGIFSYFAGQVVAIIARFASIIIFTPVFLLPAFVVASAGLYLGNMYLKAQLSTKREMSNALSPLLSHFSASIHGLVSIRAYGAQSAFKEESLKRINHYIRITRPNYNLNRWIGIRIDFLGAVFTSALAAYLVYGPAIGASDTGFILSVASSFTMIIYIMVRQFNNLQVESNSLERIQDYLDIDHEPPFTEAGRPPAAWPTSGDLRVENLSARYSKTGPLVLQNLTFHIQSGQRVGVVGRTGSGKSSLTLSLLRCIVMEGEIFYDGLPTSRVNLEDLRSNITIIPQTPELLSGTLRQNLDPFGKEDDAVLNDALRSAGLFALQEAGGDAKITLDTDIAGGGTNLSVGQRQILALARAILRRSKLLILDEATSAIDYKNDTIIQTTLRTQLDPDVTVITVAHRLQTIMDSDKIMVLDAGKLIEFDTPANLLRNPSSMLRTMVDSSKDSATLSAMAGLPDVPSPET